MPKNTKEKIRFEFVNGNHLDLDRYDGERDIYEELKEKVDNKPNGSMWWGDINLLNVCYFYIIEKNGEDFVKKTKIHPKEKIKKIK